jgi:hypothetical protein
MPFVPFHDFYPDLAERETRNLTLMEPVSDLINPAPDLPADTYAMVELYCNDPGCDCRRVMFMVIAKQRGPLAVVAYGWESLKFYSRWMHSDKFTDAMELKGPVLNFGSPQSKYAPAVLRMVDEVLLADPAYIERLKRHYQMVRDAVDGDASRTSAAALQWRRDTAERKRVFAGKMRELQARRSQKKRRAR